MSYFVTVFNLEAGVNEELIGPFESAADAMTWADQESLLQTTEEGMERETSDELIIVSKEKGEDEIAGYMYQVLEAGSPDDGEEEPDPVPVEVQPQPVENT